MLELDPVNPASEIFVAALAELGFESFEDTDTGLRAYIPERDWDQAALESLPYWHSDQWKSAYSVTRIPRENWNARWEADYTPIVVDHRCVVRAPFHPEPDAGVTYDLVIEPKMSFGTGHHQTTWLMLRTMLDLDFQGLRVLDMGAGTGVLAILAARMGAASVDAVDIDPWAAENSRENAGRNGVGNLEATTGDASAITGREFDCILANINKNILLRDLPVYRRTLQSGGMLLLSGFYLTDLPDLRQAAEQLGLGYRGFREKEQWVSAVFQLPD